MSVPVPPVGKQNKSPVRSTAALINKGWIIPAALFAFALCVRLYCLNCYSLWYDEVSSLSVAQWGFESIFNDRFGWLGNQPPLHYLLVWLTTLPADPANTAFFVRLPSAIAGALIAPLIYGLGRDLFNRNTGIMAAALVALSPALIDYSQDLRPYSMLAFLTVLSIYLLQRAVRTGDILYWAAFTAVTVLNLLNCYMACALVMTAMALPLLWYARKVWIERAEKVRSVYFGAAAGVIIGASALAVYLDASKTSRTSLNLLDISNYISVAFLLQLMSWATLLLSAPYVALYVWVILGLVGLGAVGAWLKKERIGAYLCLSFFLVPIILLHIISATQEAFPRYVLFMVPFLYLLVARGAFVLVEGIGRVSARAQRQQAFRAIAYVIPIFVFAPFLLVAWTYFTPYGHQIMSFRPDFRGVASYLSKNLKDEDIAIFLDEPAFGAIVSGFYWHNSPPGQAYDARDPRLSGVHSKGDIYWIATRANTSMGREAGNSRYTDIENFENVSVFLERKPDIDISSGIEQIVGELASGEITSPPALTLQGSAQQNRGDINSAVLSYKSAGVYFLDGGVGDVYVRTVEGLIARHRLQAAWNEAMLLKFLEPQYAQTHRTISNLLLDMGYPEYSRVEDEIAGNLDSPP